MILIIGGAFQGKKEYAALTYKVREEECFDAVLPSENKDSGDYYIIDHLHAWIRETLKKGENPEEKIESFLQKRNCILICDEIGNGIVPTDSFERGYRERTGRILIRIAEEADEVVRVFCGIGQKIK